MRENESGKAIFEEKHPENKKNMGTSRDSILSASEVKK